MNKSVEMNDRHCALCGKYIPGKRVKKHRCPHCLRRAYCSYNCRIKDWTSKKGQPPSESNRQGQGHSDWCSLLPGEEDLDWIVAPSDKNHRNNGLGLFAKRHFPTMTRIMVEGDFNRNGIPEMSSYGRMQMANHDCNPNTSIHYATIFSGVVFYSKRDIQPGEEICINYVPYGEPFAYPIIDPYHPGRLVESFADSRTLLEKRGVVCPANCFCYRKDIDDLIPFGRTGFDLLNNIANVGINEITRSRPYADMWLGLTCAVLEIHREIGATWMQKVILLEAGFIFALFQKRTLPLAKKIGEATLKITGRICHPEEAVSLRSALFMQNPENLVEYLALENQPEEENPVFGDDDIEELMNLI